jgi:hypothetical protein
VVQHRANKESKRLQTVPGIGIIGASAITRDGDKSQDLSIRERLCGLDRAGATTNVDRGKTEARTDLQTGRPLPAAHSWWSVRFPFCAGPSFIQRSFRG